MKIDLGKLREWFDKLAPRERRLLMVLIGLLALAAVFAVPLSVELAIGARRDANRAIAEAMDRIKSSRDDIQKRQLKRDAIAQRYANRAPPLAGLLEKAARDNHLDIPESSDRPEVPHGKRYVERTTVVRLRKATMLALSKTLEQLEQQRMPIAISRLNIRRRGGEKDSYDVELGLSAYDRNEPTKEAKGGGDGKTEAKAPQDSKTGGDSKVTTPSPVGGPK